jgi:hypothetical protein
MCCSFARPCGRPQEVDLRARGPRAALPVRARQPVIRERLPSYSEPASRDPQAEPHVTVTGHGSAYRFAFSPPLLRVSRCSWASSRLAPSLLCEALRPPGVEDARCVEPTSATRTTCVHPHLARSRLALAALAASMPHGVLGSARPYRGTGRFHDVRARFGGSSRSFRERCLPTLAGPIEPLTPLSPLPRSNASAFRPARSTPRSRDRELGSR